MPKPKKKTSQVTPARSAARPGPVTVTRLPVVRCEICGRSLTYRPEQGTASEVLTGHYLAAGHADTLASA